MKRAFVAKVVHNCDAFNCNFAVGWLDLLFASAYGLMLKALCCVAFVNCILACFRVRLSVHSCSLNELDNGEC